MFTERFIDTGEVRIRVLAGPDDGPPILFLHGLSRVGRDFVPLFPSLSGSWHIHAARPPWARRLGANARLLPRHRLRS